MIITPRVYVHRRLNQAQKAVLAGNYKLAAAITHHEMIRLKGVKLWNAEVNLFMNDHKSTFTHWIFGYDSADTIKRLHQKQSRRMRHARP